MTREEAINHLKTVAKSAIDSGYDGAVVDAVNMAREALEQEPCEDCISRDKARKLIRKRLYESALNNVDHECKASDIFEDIAENRLESWLAELPTVQPKVDEKKWAMLGRWKANLKFGAYPTEQMWICSICGYQDMQRHHHCPKCETDMLI